MVTKVNKQLYFIFLRHSYLKTHTFSSNTLPHMQMGHSYALTFTFKRQ
jgi:hypothetical protein